MKNSIIREIFFHQCLKIKKHPKMNAFNIYLIKPLFLNKGLISGSCPVKSLNA